MVLGHTLARVILKCVGEKNVLPRRHELHWANNVILSAARANEVKNDRCAHTCYTRETRDYEVHARVRATVKSDA